MKCWTAAAVAAGAHCSTPKSLQRNISLFSTISACRTYFHFVICCTIYFLAGSGSYHGFPYFWAVEHFLKRYLHFCIFSFISCHCCCRVWWCVLNVLMSMMMVIEWCTVHTSHCQSRSFLGTCVCNVVFPKGETVSIHYLWNIWRMYVMYICSGVCTLRSLQLSLILGRRSRSCTWCDYY